MERLFHYDYVAQTDQGKTQESIVLQTEDPQRFEETSRGYNPHRNNVTVSAFFPFISGSTGATIRF